jgi:hypothetical protein
MEGDSTPSVSSQIEQMLPDIPQDEMPHLDDIPQDEMPQDEMPQDDIPQYEMPHLEKTTDDGYEADDEYVDEFRRIAIYSEDGQDSFILASYTNSYGTKRIMLNDVDISLKDFRRYLNCVSESEYKRNDELFYVGIQASFMTGLVVLLIALGLTILKSHMAKN